MARSYNDRVACAVRQHVARGLRERVALTLVLTEATRWLRDVQNRPSALLSPEGLATPPKTTHTPPGSLR